MTSPEGLFAGGGTTGELMAALDWSATPVGPVDAWPQSLRSAVRVVLSSRYPMLLLWGPQYTQLYNDAYSALIGDRHPAALGGDVRVTLAEGWDVLAPLIHDAMATGVASWVPALQLLLNRAGYREEAYFSVSHAPARDDAGATVGVLTVCSEVTEQVIGERRLRLLRDLSLRAGGYAADVATTCAQLIEVIGGHRLDVPFAAVYLRDGDVLRRIAATGTDASGDPVGPALPDVVPVGGEPAAADPWQLRAAATGTSAQATDVSERLAVRAGPWDDPVGTALTLPLPTADRQQPLGVLLTGVSPSCGLDEAYRSFFELLTQQVAVAVRNTQVHEEERRRAEALAELDRAKTDFFTNVSHEFRTPLTLLLGPLADALADSDEPLTGTQRERVDTAWRNTERLLSLVNSLLTFAGLQAGRAGVAAREVDLAELTAGLVSVFRSAVERAGLRFVVDCPPLPHRVAVDPVDWEKVVTNLVSNALKFTFVGEIRVALDSDDQHVRLTVADTGIGIAAADQPRLFERFHRLHGARSRSHEGTGIGLALVRELTLLQGGDVQVESTPGSGTTFVVTLPWSAITTDGARPAAVGGTGSGAIAQAAARDALGWLGEPAQQPERADVTAGATRPDGEPADARILVADDNRDMRTYLQQLLGAQGWDVETVADGQAALDVIRERPPDLLLTDVMMPVLDGFALVRALRRDEATRALPIVVLSARAGQEAGVEGLDLGADDYVVKPFAAAELVARIRAAMRIARVRGRHTRQLSALADTAAVIASGRTLEDAVQEVTERARRILGGRSAVTVLDGDGGRPALRFTAGADGTGAGATVAADVLGRSGDRIGSVTVHLPAGRPPDDAAALLAPMAHMISALAVSTWRLDREKQVALALRQSLLPAGLPQLDGWEVSARYLPAIDGAEAGGDFYDVVALPGGEAIVGIGEVAGDGLGAAVTMAQLRTAIRAYAVEDTAPAKIVTRLGTLVTRLGTSATATVLIGHLDLAGGVLTWCSAGHPAPLRGTTGAHPAPLTGTVGPALGTAGSTYAETSTVLDPGESILLFTDGIAADPQRDPGAGPERLAAAVAPVMGTAVPVQAIVDAVTAALPDPRTDDVVVLALRRLPPPPRPAVAELADLRTRWTYPLLPTAAATMRRDVRAVLGDRGIDDDLLDDLLIAASEAVNNAVEHAQQPTRLEVQVRLTVADGTVRISVQDYGNWRGRRPAMDRGRGAMLMNAYGKVRVAPSATGTLVTIERQLDPAATD